MLRRMLVVGASGLALFAFGLTSASSAEPQSGHDQFEVVSLKYSGQLMDHQTAGNLPRRLEFKSSKLSGDSDLGSYMEFVFPGVLPGKLIPAFREFYRIEAIAPSGTRLDDARAMLLKVLVERLGLQYHMEARQAPIYYLVRGSGTLRLSPPKAGRGSKVQSTFQLKSNAEPVQRLASFLQSLTGREVIDKTGIDGLFSFDIDLLNEIQAQPDAGTSLAIAEAKRLGLKLEPGTTTRTYFIVDKVAKYPTPN